MAIAYNIVAPMSCHNALTMAICYTFTYKYMSTLMLILSKVSST